MKDKDKQALERTLTKELADLLDIIWELSDSMTIAELANESGLSSGTVSRLYHGNWRRPQFLTIQKLAYAVDLHVTLNRDGSVGLQVVDKPSVALGKELVSV